MILETATRSFAIRRATVDDIGSVGRLLESNALPVDGVAEAIGDFLVAEGGSRSVGVVGMEYRGAHGLLRSTAVDADWRNRSVARALVERIIIDAEARGTRALYLLTTTAEQYFPSFGFSVASRDAVPEEIQATAEFRGACPASATVMWRPTTA
jgi:N-acetylglutamate synthase-like GNAT family acetyltransferase